MNIIKRIMILSCAVILVNMNIKSMDDPASASQRSYLRTKFDENKGLIDILDGLVQATSIYSVDSKDSKVVGSLAGARSIVNAGIILSILSDFENLLARNQNLKISNLVDIFSFCVRGNNLFKDVNNLKNADSLALQNVSKKNDKGLKNKQYCQYAWLAVNKFLPFIMSPSRIGETPYVRLLRSPMLLELSELYRQKLMYAMISNKKSA